MSEVRAPDPTLTAIGSDVVQLFLGDLPIAHQYVGALGPRAKLPCGTTLPRGKVWSLQLAAHARWFAVPCRECFPDAPPPGTDPLNRPNAGRYLAWQVTA